MVHYQIYCKELDILQIFSHEYDAIKRFYQLKQDNPKANIRLSKITRLVKSLHPSKQTGYILTAPKLGIKRLFDSQRQAVSMAELIAKDYPATPISIEQMPH